MQADSFHRLAKTLADSGEAASIAEAMDAFSRYGVRVRLPRSAITDEASQIIMLTAINTASRSFLGNVVVDVDDFELSVRGFEGRRLHEFMDWADVRHTVGSDTAGWPKIAISDSPGADEAIAVWASGWHFGLGAPRGYGNTFVPACVAAGGLAVSEAFSVLRRDSPYAGHRGITLSLWNPQDTAAAPSPSDVPPQDGLWLVGLGHLGQAYGWTLGFMGPGVAPLVLQDVDTVTKSTLSTSMLSTRADIGQRKSRVTARWLEARGFETAIVERRFDDAQRVGAGEPAVALFGVDNPAARRVLEGCGFRLVVDAGLGSGYRDFRAIRVRMFPGPSTAATLWAAPAETGVASMAPAYRKLIDEGADQCGVTTLATRAVGAPFVGCVAAGYVLAERIRRQIGGPHLGFVDLSLREPNRMEAG